MMVHRMERLGTPLHKVHGYIILRARVVPRIGAPVFDGGGRRVGVVADVFGPVNNPYIAVKGKEGKDYFIRPKDLWG